MDTKKLRQKILDLAIRGKLVPQDPNDEPASVLLERIRAEKERLIKEGKIKRSKKSASDTPHYENRQVGEANEVPFEVPESWEWTTIGEIASSILYGVSESAKETGQYKLLRITDIQNNKVNWETVPFTDYDNNKAQAYLLNDGDILFARTGATVGKSYLVEGLKDSAIYASYLIRVQTSSVILPAYIKFFFESGFYWEQISLNSVGIGQPNVNGTTLAALTIPIPPYREQMRIVEEAKKWLSVIDGLDIEIDDLLTFITQAKSKILDLAIHGKLVPQDPNDEPAIELLKRINPQFTPCDNAHYENVPSSWIKVPLGNICTLNEGEPISDKEYLYIDVKGLRTGNFASKQSGKYVPVGTTLILVDGENSGEVFYTPVEGYQGSTMKVLNIDSNMNTQYVLYFVNLHQRALRENKVGSAIPHLNKKMFRELIIPIPPIGEQERIVEAILQYYRLLDNISANL